VKQKEYRVRVKEQPPLISEQQQKNKKRKNVFDRFVEYMKTTSKKKKETETHRFNAYKNSGRKKGVFKCSKPGFSVVVVAMKKPAAALVQFLLLTATTVYACMCVNVCGCGVESTCFFFF
jgi:hypothetical protein